MRAIKKYSVLAGLLLPAMGFAQQRDNEGSGITQEVITIGNRDIKLRDAYRISGQPQLFDTAIVKSNVKYEIKPAQIATKYAVDTIEAANLRIVEPLPKLYHFYVKGGVGMYTSPIGELYYNSLRSRKGVFGFGAKHYSSAGGVNGVLSNGAFSQNQAQMWGKTFLGKHGLIGGVSYDRNTNYFYGYDKSLVIPGTENGFKKDSIQQRFETISGDLKFESYYDNLKKLNHVTELSYYNLSDHYRTAEQNIKFGLGLSKAINNELFGLRVAVDNNHVKFGDTLVARRNNAIFNFSPSVTTSKEKYKLKVGLSVFGQAEKSTKFYFFPEAEFNYYLVDNVIMPYAGVSGSVQRNSFRSASTVNPYINSNLNLLNSIEKYKVYAGIRGNFSASSSFNLAVSQSKVEQLQMFVNDTLGYRNRFDAIYDNASITHLTGELSFHLSQKFQLLTKAEYFIYKLDSLPRAFNLPTAKLTVNGKYNLVDKLYITADFFVESNRFAWVPQLDNTYQLVNLGEIVDLNLGVEYRYTKRLSAFLNFNNLAAQKYQKYYRYNVQGLNVFGGFTFSF